MKKASLVCSSLMALILFGPSCSKKNDSKPACKIVSITDAGANSTTFTLSYNGDGKLATLQSVSGSTTSNKVFTYTNNVILITTTTGSNVETDSVVINGDGLVESDLHRYGPDDKEVTTYTYSGTQVQKFVSQYNDEDPTTITATYTNGDLTSLSDGESFTYNTDKSASQGDYLALIQLIQYGAPFVKSAHQVKGFQSGSTVENFTYTYDTNGNVSTLTATSGSSVETITYEYNCNN